MILQKTNADQIDAATHKGCTAMFLACWRGHIEIAQMLHQAGAKVDRDDNEGRTMEARALEWNHKKVVEWLQSLKKEGK